MTRPTYIGRRDGRLTCECWCRAKVLLLPASMVRQGTTGSCGRPDCRPPKEKP